MTGPSALQNVFPNNPPAWLSVQMSGQFGLAKPANQLGVDDVDGDGHDDLLLATGAAWYYSPAGATEWHFLRASGEPLRNLLFGDFDGDGRTDVIKKEGNLWFISWRGLSEWECLNNADVSYDDVSQYAVGHFSSPNSTDLFHATGREWLLSAGGTATFSYAATSSYQVSRLRFGDFDHDGRTDVFGFENGRWRIVSGGVGMWFAPLNNQQLSTSVNGLVVADFDGDGSLDVAKGDQFSSGGKGPWQPLLSPDGKSMNVSGAAAAPGYFTGGKDAEM